MNIEEVKDYALSLPHVEETFPFGDDVIVFKIKAKIFLLLPLTTEQLQFNVKCDPDETIELREKYNCILPGYHMNKKHWNTIIADGTLTAKKLLQFIHISYSLVIGKKTKAA